MTVSELIQMKSDNKIWLCPHIVNKPSLKSTVVLKGVECTKSTVPKRLLDMQVRKHFKEAGMLCIIWVNTPEIEAQIREEELNIPEEFTTASEEDT